MYTISTLAGFSQQADETIVKIHITVSPKVSGSQSANHVVLKRRRARAAMLADLTNGIEDQTN